MSEEDKWSKERLQEELKDARRNENIGLGLGLVIIILGISVFVVPYSLEPQFIKYLDPVFWIGATLLVVLGVMALALGGYYAQKYQRLKSKL